MCTMYIVILKNFYRFIRFILNIFYIQVPYKNIVQYNTSYKSHSIYLVSQIIGKVSNCLFHTD